jgi:hypothetical protein
MSPFAVIDSSVVTDGSSARSAYVQPGPYLFEVSGAKPSSEEYEGEAYIRWRLRIKKGAEGAGRTILYTTTLSPDKQWNLGNLLFYTGNKKVAEAISGQELDTWEDFEEFVNRLAAKMKGKLVGGEVIDGSYNGRDTSEINELFPASEFAERFGEEPEAEEDEEEEEAPAPPKKTKKASEPEPEEEEIEEEEEEAPAPPKKTPAKAKAAPKGKVPAKAEGKGKGKKGALDQLNAFFEE